MKTLIATALIAATLGLGATTSALAGESFHQVKDERGVVGHVRGDGLADENADKTAVIQIKAPVKANTGTIGFDWRRAPAAERAFMNELYHGEGPKW